MFIFIFIANNLHFCYSYSQNLYNKKVFKMERQFIKVKLGHFSIEETTASSLIMRLQAFQKQYGQDVKLIPIGGYSGFDDYEVFIERFQTDEEYEAFLAAHLAEQKKKETIKIGNISKRIAKGQSISEEDKMLLAKYNIKF